MVIKNSFTYEFFYLFYLQELLLCFKQGCDPLSTAVCSTTLYTHTQTVGPLMTNNHGVKRMRKHRHCRPLRTNNHGAKKFCYLVENLVLHSCYMILFIAFGAYISFPLTNFVVQSFHLKIKKLWGERERERIVGWLTEQAYAKYLLEKFRESQGSLLFEGAVLWSLS